jgi:hypothetical protein
MAVSANQHVLANQRGVAGDERADRVPVVAPDGVREPYCVDESRPARRAVAPCKYELRVGQLDDRRIDRLGMVLAQLGAPIGIAGVDGAKKLLRLTMKLFEIGADRQAADRHGEPPERARGPLASGEGGSATTSERLAICSGGLSPLRGREAPCTPSVKLALSADCDKSGHRLAPPGRVTMT